MSTSSLFDIDESSGFSLVIELELPPSKCSSNGDKGNWRAKAAATKFYREHALAACVAALAGAGPNLPLVISMTWDMAVTPLEKQIRALRCVGVSRQKGIRKSEALKYRPNDIANAIAAVKSAVDGFIDAGLAPDDSHRWIKWGDVVLNQLRPH